MHPPTIHQRLRSAKAATRESHAATVAAASVDDGSATLARMCLDGVPVPGDRAGESVAQLRAGAEAKELLRARRVELPARLAVRHRGVPHDLAFEAGEVGDRFRELADRRLHARAEIDGIGAVVALRRQNQAFGAVVDVEEL